MKRLLTAAVLLALASPASAQSFESSFGDLSQDSPTGITDVQALASGGALAASPTQDSPFFGNPAHLAHSPMFGFTLVGASAGAGGNFRETYDFIRNELEPAFDQGIEDIRENDPERLDSLYSSALRVGRSQKTADIAVLAPSLRIRTGPVAVGVGAFGRAVSRARILDAGAGLPAVDAYAQGDVLIPAVVAARIPGAPFDLSIGASATYLQRRITAKSEVLDAIDPDNEKVHLLKGQTVRLAAGAYVRNVVVPGIDLGVSVTDIGGNVELERERSVAIGSDDMTPDDDAEIAALVTRFEERGAKPVVRVGAAYSVPLPPMSGLLIKDIRFAADYTTASTSSFDQSFQAGIRAGATATFASFLNLRAGVSQGMPSAGAGLHTKVAQLDVATYGVEDGRLLGQAPRRAYALQLRFGLF
ncbi:MAG: hypothetical protein Rubg2KO_16840 [Rubricoccaceae bacterium]